MKYFIFTLLMLLTVMVAKPTVAQTNEMPRIMPLLEVLGKIGGAGDLINKNCTLKTKTFWRSLLENAVRSTFWSLDKDLKIMRMVDNCKQRLKQKGLSNQRTDALFLIIAKLMTLTKKDWLLLKSLAPSDSAINEIFKKYP